MNRKSLDPIETTTTLIARLEAYRGRLNDNAVIDPGGLCADDLDLLINLLSSLNGLMRSYEPK